MTDIEATTPPLAAHLHAITEARLGRLLECRRYWLLPDPVEAVHDARVASRRLRAFVDVFESAMGHRAYSRAKKSLRRVTRSLGELRDADVQIDALDGHYGAAESPLVRAGIEHLLVLVRRDREPEEQRARRKLDRVDFDALAENVREAVTDVVRHLPASPVETNLLALTLIAPFIAAAEHEVPPDPENPDPDGLHRLRIAMKKIRYALELFQPVIGNRFKKLHKEAERLQELLGTHHDLRVLDAMARDAHETLEAKGYLVLGASLDELRARVRLEEQATLSTFRAAPFDPERFRQALEGALLGAESPALAPALTAT